MTPTPFNSASEIVMMQISSLQDRASILVERLENKLLSVLSDTESPTEKLIGLTDMGDTTRSLPPLFNALRGRIDHISICLDVIEGLINRIDI